MDLVTIVEAFQAKRKQETIDGFSENARCFFEIASAHMREETPEHPVIEDLDQYSHAFVAFGTGGVGKRRNELLRILFGSSYRDEWLVLVGPQRLGYVDHHSEYYSFPLTEIKSAKANFADGSIVSVFFTDSSRHYLQLRFEGFFSGQRPAEFLMKTLTAAKEAM